MMMMEMINLWSCGILPVRLMRSDRQLNARRCRTDTDSDELSKDHNASKGCSRLLSLRNHSSYIECEQIVNSTVTYYLNLQS